MASDIAVHIREASSADSDPITALLSELGYEVPAPLVADRLRRFAESNDRRVLVAEAEAEGPVVGLLSLTWQEWLSHERLVARVTELVVASTARGRGVGKKLIDEAAAIAKQRRCELIEVTTALARDEAHSFYEAAGFECTSYRYARVLA